MRRFTVFVDPDDYARIGECDRMSFVDLKETPTPLSTLFQSVQIILASLFHLQPRSEATESAAELTRFYRLTDNRTVQCELRMLPACKESLG